MSTVFFIFFKIFFNYGQFITGGQSQIVKSTATPIKKDFLG